MLFILLYHHTSYDTSYHSYLPILKSLTFNLPTALELHLRGTKDLQKMNTYKFLYTFSTSSSIAWSQLTTVDIFVLQP